MPNKVFKNYRISIHMEVRVDQFKSAKDILHRCITACEFEGVTIAGMTVLPENVGDRLTWRSPESQTGKGA